MPAGNGVAGNDVLIAGGKIQALHGFIRVQKVLNYDSNSQKGFVTERSKEEYSRCVREMKACMKEIDAQFDAAAQSYRERCGEVRSLDFWKKYLNLDK